MLKLDLARLDRESRLQIDAEIPVDDPLWEGAGLNFRGPLRVELVASSTGGGGVVVRGWVEGALDLECRRCLDPVDLPIERELMLVWTPVDELGPQEDDGETRVLDPTASELDLGAVIREELMLGTDRYQVCDPACRGLCPYCGANLNVVECDCVREERDPRWDVLRTMMSEG
jgi:uncharacterized protein